MIQVEHLTKKQGKTTLLSNINLQAQGTHALIGPEGSGKTTLLKILATQTTPTTGSITINNTPLQKEGKIRAQIGYVPQNPSFHPEKTITQELTYIAKIRGLPAKNIKPIIQQLLEQNNLLEIKNHKITTLPQDTKKHLALIAALLHNPQVLLIDELPHDTSTQRQFKDTLRKLQNKTILIAETNIDTINTLTENITIIKDGKTIFQGNTKQITNNTTNLEITLKDPEKTPQLTTTLKQHPHITKIQQGYGWINITLANTDHIPEIIRTAANTTDITQIKQNTPTLQEIINNIEANK
jgi:ABC-2 type transport system ATP-binding protein